MEPGSVVVDVAVDQGGCIETCQPDHARQPDLHRARRGPLLRGQHAGRRAADLTFALTNATRPYAAKIADLGLVEAVKARQGAGAGRSTPTAASAPTRPSPRTWATTTCPWMEALGGKQR